MPDASPGPKQAARPAASRAAETFPPLTLSGRQHASVFALLTLLSIFYTWPLAAHFTTHMPGDGGDDPALAWNLWWIKHRLINQVNLDIFHVDYMFYPIEINLAFYTLTPLNGLMSVPLQTALNLLVANNLILLATFVLGGYGTFLLTRYILAQTSSHAARPLPSATLTAIAVAAGIFYAFASAKLFYPALGQFNIASSHWIPFCALYLLRMVMSQTLRSGLRAAAFAGIFLVLQAWSELTYASFLLIFALLIFSWWLLRIGFTPAPPHTNRAGHVYRLFLSGLVFGGIFTLGLAPFLAAMLPDMQAEGDFFGMGGGFADLFSADLLGYLFPTRLHPWLGHWAAHATFPNDKGQQIFIGYSLAALACIGVWSRLRAPRKNYRAWGVGIFWTISALLFFLLTLGPNLRWAGMELPIPGPFELVSRLPFFSGNRYPSRYSVMLMLTISVLAAWGLAWLAARLHNQPSHNRRAWLSPRRGAALLTAIAVLLFTLEHLSAPLPLNDARVPAIYTTLAQQEGNFAVLELPTGWRNGARIVGRIDPVIMMQQWYQTVHEKRRLGGNTSRNPQYKFQYFTDVPLLGDLIALMNADQPHIQSVAEQELDALIARHQPTASQILADLGVRYVLLHTEPERAPPALQQFAEAALPLTLLEEWQGIDWAGNAAAIRLYAVTPPPPQDTRIVDLTGPDGNLHLAEGWSASYAGTEPVRFAHRNTVELLLPNPGPQSPARYQITLDLRFTMLDSLQLAWHGANGWSTIDTWELNGSTITFELPPDAQEPAVQSTAMHRLRLSWNIPPRPQMLSSYMTPPAQIGTTGVSLDAGLSLAVRSAGEEVGDFAAIFLNGHNVAPTTIGYNLAALTPQGQLLDAAAFDTHTDSHASDALEAWVAQWPTGTIVAGAVADEASRQLSASAVDALAHLGTAIDLRDRLRWSHAFIGVVGAPEASALEAASLLQPAAVGLGLPLESPSIYGAIESWSLIRP